MIATPLILIRVHLSRLAVDRFSFLISAINGEIPCQPTDGQPSFQKR